MQVGAVEAADGDCKRKADKVKRRECEIGDGEAGARHVRRLMIVTGFFSLLGDLRFWGIN